jgi:Tfp pilus assembly protein PilF
MISPDLCDRDGSGIVSVKHLRPALFAAALFAAGLPASAIASGGGMGGGSMPTGRMMSMPTDQPTYDPAVEYQDGLTALQAGKWRDAENHFDNVLEVDPTDVDTNFYMGQAKAGRGDFRGAQRAYEKALKLDPNRIDARREYAVVLAKQNQPDDAKKQLDILQQRATTCGDTCADSADLKAAIATVTAALSPKTAANLRPPSLLLTPSVGDSAYVQAVRLINQHRYDQALAQLSTAQAVFGPHPDVLTYIGYTYRKMGQWDKAEQYYREALTIAPNHVGATEYYGELMVERGDIAGAKRMLAKLETVCTFGCIETEDLRRWIEKGPQS